MILLSVRGRPNPKLRNIKKKNEKISTSILMKTKTILKNRYAYPGIELVDFEKKNTPLLLHEFAFLFFFFLLHYYGS